MGVRASNFSAGPAGLPDPVIDEIRAECGNFEGLGASAFEISHRSRTFSEISERARSLSLELLGLDPSKYTALFLQGGARFQFVMAPMNFAQETDSVGVIDTGIWTKKAIGEIEAICGCDVLASGKDANYSKLPEVPNQQNPKLRYLHYCSNNTIYGTQWTSFANPQKLPLVIDMSSDILSRELDHSQFDLIYAGAQKNLGPAGLCLVVIKNSWMDAAREDLPEYLQYRKHAEADSMFNTPSTFSIYVVDKVLRWIKDLGGIHSIEKQNIEKSKMLYDFLDKSSFYSSMAAPEDRSRMNIVFKTPSEDLDQKFVEQAEQNFLMGLKGHRAIGGLRASCYNAVKRADLEKLLEFMTEFERSV